MKDATLRQAEKILSLFSETPLEQVQEILESGLLTDLRDGNIVQVNRDEFRKLLGLNPLTTKEPYPLSVDYGMSVEDLVRLGHYDRSHSDITSAHFSTKRKGKAEITIELINFSRNIGPDELRRELNRLGHRPAEIHELLAFGEKYPDVQREFPVISLGSVWQNPHGGCWVPYLDGSRGSERRLDLLCLGDGWSKLCRFAVVQVGIVS